MVAQDTGTFGEEAGEVFVIGCCGPPSADVNTILAATPGQGQETCAQERKLGSS